MAESEFQEVNYDDRRKMKDDVIKELEDILERMEELTVHTTWILYNFIAIRTNPDLSNAMQHLEEAFLKCKEKIENKCQEVLME
ncbi:SYCE3 protein, partial [Erpornis zantholeuca]|nr:SYCE3 protein [Erpornis zantholeuca]